MLFVGSNSGVTKKFCALENKAKTKPNQNIFLMFCFGKFLEISYKISLCGFISAVVRSEK